MTNAQKLKAEIAKLRRALKAADALDDELCMVLVAYDLPNLAELHEEFMAARRSVDE